MAALVRVQLGEERTRHDRGKIDGVQQPLRTGSEMSVPTSGDLIRSKLAKRSGQTDDTLAINVGHWYPAPPEDFSSAGSQ